MKWQHPSHFTITTTVNQVMRNTRSLVTQNIKDLKKSNNNLKFASRERTLSNFIIYGIRKTTKPNSHPILSLLHHAPQYLSTRHLI